MPPRETRAADDNFADGDAILRDDIAKLYRRRLQATTRSHDRRRLIPWALTLPPGVRHRVVTMDPHERAPSVWYRVAGLLRRKEIVIEIIEAEIRSAQQEVWREAAKLVLTGDAIEIARRMHDRAERVIKRE